MIVMAVVMLLVIQVLSNAAIDSEIKRELARSMKTNLHNVSVRDGNLEIDEDFLYRSDMIYFMIVRRNGEILAGEYPEKTEEELLGYPIGGRFSSSVTCGGETYYLRDVRIGKRQNNEVYLRGVVRKSDADSFYRGLEMISYISVISVLAVILICEIFLAGRISKELKNMCRIAESVSSSLDISKRMGEEEYRFHEIAVLAKANDRMLDRLEQTFLLQEQFTADVAHELRTPVSVVMAQCQYAEEKVSSAEEHREILKAIYRQMKKIDTLILQLLNLSRLDQDRMQIQNETLDLVEMVQSVSEDLQEKGIGSITITLRLQEAYATGDIGLILIVIQNLLTNAIKFSHPNGQIVVCTGEENDQVYVSVEDFGIGIAQEDQEFIFRRFYKCDKSRNAEGFGLGLPLSEKIAKKHGGRITVSSEAGRGSVFTLYLPGKAKTDA